MNDPPQRWVLRLYVTGGSPRSTWAIRNVNRICEGALRGRVDLSVIDIYQQPALAAEAQLVAAPTLVKELPPPRRRFIGTMEDERTLLAGLGVEPDPPGGGEKGGGPR